MLGIRPTEEASVDHLELRKHMAKALNQISDAPNLLREPDRIHTPAILVWWEDFGEIARSDLPHQPRPTSVRRLYVAVARIGTFRSFKIRYGTVYPPVRVCRFNERESVVHGRS